MYRVFAWSSYYPNGGLNDLRYESDSIEECWKYLAEYHYDHYQIVGANFQIIVEG